jgi:hypothetical protein
MQDDWNELYHDRSRILAIPWLQKYLDEGDKRQQQGARDPEQRYAQDRRREIIKLQKLMEQAAFPGKHWKNPFFQRDVKFARDVTLAYGVYAIHSPTVQKVLHRLNDMVDDVSLEQALRTSAFGLMEELLATIRPHRPRRSDWTTDTLRAAQKRHRLSSDYPKVLAIVACLRRKNPNNSHAWHLALQERFQDVPKDVFGGQTESDHMAEAILAHRNGLAPSTVHNIRALARRDRKPYPTID